MHEQNNDRIRVISRSDIGESVASPEYGPDTRISQIEPIQETSMIIKGEKDLEHYVEPPLLKACKILFEKGIHTYMSSANRQCCGSNSWVNIYLDDLSEENKRIVNDCASETGYYQADGSGPIKVLSRKLDDSPYISITKRSGNAFPNFVTLEIPTAQDSTMRDVETASIKLTDIFKSQPAEWIESFDSYGAFMDVYYMDTPYYDLTTKKFYLSKELCDLKKRLEQKRA